MNRHKMSSEDRKLQEEVEKSLKTSTYAEDAILNKILYGKDPDKGSVPNYGSGQASSHDNESSSLFPMDLDAMTKIATDTIGAGGVKEAMQDVWDDGSVGVSQLNVGGLQVEARQESQPQQPSGPKRVLSKNQWDAVQKYPALIEILGSDEGKELVSIIAAHVNKIMINKIAVNSKKACPKYAFSCEADKHNIKHYFVPKDESWVCKVIASGPFRGDEAIFYDPDNDKAFVLRESNDDYEDVSGSFNVIHEFTEKE